MNDRAKKRYFLELGFLGSAYAGWQVQENAPSVQEEVEKALSLLLREPIRVTGAGRTDTGVHAHCFYAHFDSSQMPGESRLAKSFLFKLNHVLPKDIAARAIHSVPPNAHARFDALSRTYAYHIIQRKNPFMQDRAWFMERPLQLDAMMEATAKLKEYTDFGSFAKANSQVKTHICHIMHATWRVEGDLLVFEIQANRFLRNMVRAIVGTLVDVGLGKLDPQAFARIIESKDRRRAGYSAPGCGLYLLDITYPPGLLA